MNHERAREVPTSPRFLRMCRARFRAALAIRSASPYAVRAESAALGRVRGIGHWAESAALGIGPSPRHWAESAALGRVRSRGAEK
jgi:hypothetical protein